MSLASTLRIVAIGGTFDKLHKGHRKIISKALQIGNRVIIGLTSDMFTANKNKKHSIRNFESRKSSLKLFLSFIDALDKTEIVPLDDDFGPTILNEQISAIVVSYETIKTAFEINRIRINRGMTPIQIYVIDYIYAENGQPISTSRISQGFINEEGKVLKKKP